jgi:hypothetical protein
VRSARGDCSQSKRVADAVRGVAEPRDEVRFKVADDVRNAMDRANNRRDETGVVEAERAIWRKCRRARRGDELRENLLDRLGDKAELAAAAENALLQSKENRIERVDRDERR